MASGSLILFYTGAILVALAFIAHVAQTGEADAADIDDAATPSWNPGRGATAKRGNPKRLPKSERPGSRR